MSQRDSVAFSFTQLLYGVVTGTAITRIGSLSLTPDTILLIVALLLVFDVYLLYHQDVQKIEGTGRNFVSLFLFDKGEGPDTLFFLKARAKSASADAETFHLALACFRGVYQNVGRPPCHPTARPKSVPTEIWKCDAPSVRR